MTHISAITTRFRRFWGREERVVLIANLIVHLLVQLFALTLMPLAYFSELSKFDGAVYYEISQNLWPAQPLFLLHWHKRILMPVLANVVFPWDRHISFLVIGIGAASLSAVYFYKIAKKHSLIPIKLTAIYSLLPWLFLSAHLGLNEPLLLLFLLAGYYYYTENRPWSYTICFALALLTKEIAVIPILALTVLIWKRYGWKRAAVFAPVVLPFGIFCLAYGLHWNDCLWCARTIPETSFTWQTGLWWMFMTLKTGIHSSTNSMVNFGYNLFNQILNLGVLTAIAIGIYRLRRVDFDLMLYNLLISVPLFFLGKYIYTFNSDMGRQYLISCLVIIGLDGIWTRVAIGRNKRINRIALLLFLTGMLGLSVFWIVGNSGFFLNHKLF
jgi:hypothetical protein